MKIFKAFTFVLVTNLSLQLAAHAQSSYVCDNNQVEHIMVWSLDVSSSMNKSEYRTQLDGYINALMDQGISSNLLYCQCTEIAVVLWAENSQMRYNFRMMANPQSIKNLIQSLEEMRNSFDRHFALGMQTDILQSLNFIEDRLMVRSHIWPEARMSVMVSGDGVQNQVYPGILKRFNEQKQRFETAGITVHGVPIVLNPQDDYVSYGNQSPNNPYSSTAPQSGDAPFKDLEDFYRQIIKTYDGFVERAEDFEGFGESIRRSILRDTCLLMM